MCFQENGIYVVAKLILPQDPAAKAASLQVGPGALCTSTEADMSVMW